MSRTEQSPSLTRELVEKQQQLYAGTKKVMEICVQISALEEQAKTDPEAARKLTLMGDYPGAIQRFCNHIKTVTEIMHKLKTQEQKTPQQKPAAPTVKHFKLHIA